MGDFTKALKKVIADYSLDRILIEPSGVRKLSDVAAAVGRVDDAKVGSRVTPKKTLRSSKASPTQLPPSETDASRSPKHPASGAVSERPHSTARQLFST